jgi:hypothetical protein
VPELGCLSEEQRLELLVFETTVARAYGNTEPPA